MRLVVLGAAALLSLCACTGGSPAGAGPRDAAEPTAPAVLSASALVAASGGAAWTRVGAAGDYTPRPCGHAERPSGARTQVETWRSGALVTQVSTTTLPSPVAAKTWARHVAAWAGGCSEWLEPQQAFASTALPRRGAILARHVTGSNTQTAWAVLVAGARVTSVTVSANREASQGTSTPDRLLARVIAALHAAR